jgi:hypothetical protein
LRAGIEAAPEDADNMGCSNAANDQDAQMLEQAARGASSGIDPTLLVGDVAAQVPAVLESIVGQMLPFLPPSTFIRPQLVDFAERELGLKGTDGANRQLFQERLSEQFVREAAKADGVPYHSLFEKAPPFVISKEAVATFYRSSSLKDKDVMSQRLGEEASERLCRLMGYKPVLTGDAKGWTQGMDSVWFDPHKNQIVVVEAKGGDSRAKMARGWRQGELFKALEDARATLKSDKPSHLEKEVAENICRLVPLGQVRVELIQAKHVAGIPTMVVIKKVREVINFRDDEAYDDNEGESF